MQGGQKSWRTTVGISSTTSRLSGSAGLPITPRILDEGDDGLTLIYDDRRGSASLDSNTDSDAFFEGYRAGMRMQFEEDQVILSGYRDHIAQLEQEVKEHQRLEVIKDEARREERKLQSQLLNDLDIQHARAIQEVREDLRRQRVEMEERYGRCKIREGRYRERVLSLTKELNEARDDLLALRIAYGEFDDDYFESEGQAANINPYLPWINSPVSPLSPTSISFSSESTLSSLSAGALQEIAVDVDMGLNDERKICFQRSVSVEEPEAEAIENPATWKGKGKEVFVDVIEHESGHGFASKRRYSGSSNDTFDIEIDLDAGISDSGSSDSDVEVDVESLPDSPSSISLLPAEPITATAITPVKSHPPNPLAPLTGLSHETTVQRHIAISDLDIHQLRALMEAAHAGNQLSGDTATNTPLRTVKRLIQEAEIIPRQKRTALQIYLLTYWRSKGKKLKLPGSSTLPNSGVTYHSTTFQAAPTSVTSLDPFLQVTSSEIWAPPMVFVDASGYGIGLVLRERWLAWRFAAGHPGIPIGPDKHIVMSWAELVAVELGILTLIAAGYRNARIVVRSDNDGVVKALLRRSWTNRYGLNRILERILSLCNKPSKDAMSGRSPYNLDLGVTWVRSEDNPADGPSRGVYPSKDMMLPHEPILPEYLVGLLHPVK